MKNSSEGYLTVLVPRGLVDIGGKILTAQVNQDGFCPLRITYENGVISSIDVIAINEINGYKILLPRLIEPHAHLDKAFTWERSPNYFGTYQNALYVNLKENKRRSLEDINNNLEISLKLALKNGVRAIRSHIDSYGNQTDQLWELLKTIQNDWKDLVDLQWVALAPIEYWSTKKGNILAAKVASIGGLLGGVLLPPFKASKDRDHLINLISLANDIGSGLDLHVDESQSYPAAGVSHLISVLDQIGLKVPITCSHLSSMCFLSPARLREIAEKLADLEIKVISLPLTNSWLLGKKHRLTPYERPLAPIHQLQASGVVVGIGGDNVQDSWFPAGNLDPLALMGLALPIAQLAPWERLGIAPFTTSAANLMGLSWDGTLKVGSPADFILLDSRSWPEVLSSPPTRQVMVKGKWLND